MGLKVSTKWGTVHFMEVDCPSLSVKRDKKTDSLPSDCCSVNLNWVVNYNLSLN